MNVALVSVGDELLSGDTVNTNAAWLGERLTKRGASVERVTVVPDRVADIARIVNEHAAEYDAVIVTGGLGPTHDDLTMEAVAAAVGQPLERSEKALEWLDENGGYSRSELTKGTADLPGGSRPLHNTVGVAPGCAIENIYVLPGVPAEMQAMFESIADVFEGEPRHVESVTLDEPESALVDRLQELQERFEVKVGSYPGENVRVKIESTDRAAVERAAGWLRENGIVAKTES
jgi:molybdenum cofactor synthesis domain-containing protein